MGNYTAKLINLKTIGVHKQRCAHCCPSLELILFQRNDHFQKMASQIKKIANH